MVKRAARCHSALGLLCSMRSFSHEEVFRKLVRRQAVEHVGILKNAANLETGPENIYLSSPAPWLLSCPAVASYARSQARGLEQRGVLLLAARLKRGARRDVHEPRSALAPEHIQTSRTATALAAAVPISTVFETIVTTPRARAPSYPCSKQPATFLRLLVGEGSGGGERPAASFQMCIPEGPGMNHVRPSSRASADPRLQLLQNGANLVFVAGFLKALRSHKPAGQSRAR